jgi:hypothetical protein
VDRGTVQLSGKSGSQWLQGGGMILVAAVLAVRAQEVQMSTICFG